MREDLVLDAGFAADAAPGESVCGDVVRVARDGEKVIAIVADGLGHGPAAAVAAERCVAELAKAPPDDLPGAFLDAHRALRGTRGAVAAVAVIDGTTRAMEVAILGNIVVRVGSDDGRSTTIIGAPGVLGSVFRTVRPERTSLAAGNVVVMHSDGLHTHFDFLRVRAVGASAAARALLTGHRRPHDDAACVVVRVLPPATVVAPSPSEPAGRAADRCEVPVRTLSDVQVAATAARAFVARLGFAGRQGWEVGIAAAELAQNAVKYGGEGVVVLSSAGDGCLVLEAFDRGPGFQAGVVRPGLREGLGAVERMMDSLEVQSGPLGTRVLARKQLR